MKSVTAALVFVLILGVAGAQEPEQVLRVYDISSLTEPRVPTYGSQLGSNATTWWAGRTETPGRPKSVRLFEPETVADVIRETIDPDSWDVGTLDALESHRLILRNRPENVKKAEDVLGELQQVASRRVLLSVKVLDLPPVLYPVAAAGRIPLSGGEKPDLARAVELESASAEAPPGLRRSLKVTNRVRYVMDYDVEIAQGSNISDPVVDAAEEGLVVDLVPHPTIDGSRIVVETILQHGRFDQPMRSVTLATDEEYLPEPYRSEQRSSLGTLQLPVFRHRAAVSTNVVRPGETFAVPVLGGGRLRVLLVRADLLGWNGAARFVDCGALAHVPQAQFIGYHPGLESDRLLLTAPGLHWRPAPAARLFGSLEEVLDLAASNVEPEYWEERGILGVASGTHKLLFAGPDEEAARKVRAYLSEREKELLHPVRTDLRVYSTEHSVTPGAQRGFSEEGARLVSAGTVSSLPGRVAGLLAGNTMNYVADYDVEVAQEARIADPMVGQSFEGLVANLTPRLSVDRSRLRLAVELLIAHRSSEFRFDAGTQFIGPVEEVAVKRTVLNTSVEMAAGELYVLDAGPDPADSSRRLAVVIRAAWD